MSNEGKYIVTTYGEITRFDGESLIRAESDRHAAVFNSREDAADFANAWLTYVSGKEDGATLAMHLDPGYANAYRIAHLVSELRRRGDARLIEGGDTSGKVRVRLPGLAGYAYAKVEIEKYGGATRENIPCHKAEYVSNAIETYRRALRANDEIIRMREAERIYFEQAMRDAR